MKRLIALLCASLLCSQAGQAPSFSQDIETLWLQGHKEKIAEIAQQRLNLDPGDIVGLLLKLEYEIAFVKTDDIPATMARIEQAGNKITSPNFKEAWPEAQSLIVAFREVLKHYTKKQIDIDRKKTSIPGKPLLFLFLLEAAEQDGLHQQKAPLTTTRLEHWNTEINSRAVEESWNGSPLSVTTQNG